MRTLPKHLRPRWRYLGIEIETWPGTEIDRRRFQGALWAAARGLLGDPGSADCDLTLVRFRFDDERGIGDAIVRVRREEVSRGRAALACVSDIDGAPVGLAVRGVSGTIRGCRDRLRDRSMSDSGTDTDAETTVRFPAVDRPPTGPPPIDPSAADRSPPDRSPPDRPAVEKPGGRFDVHVDTDGENGFLGAMALDVEADHETGEDDSTES